MDKKKRALEYFSALTTGSLITSVAFYFAYGQHWPMVISAGAVSAMHLIKHLVALDGY